MRGGPIDATRPAWLSSLFHYLRGPLPEGPRSGALFEGTLQIGDDTIALSNLASLSLDEVERRPRTLILSLAAAVFLILAAGFAATFAAAPDRFDFNPTIPAAVVLFCALGAGGALHLKSRLAYTFHELSFGASDGSRIVIRSERKTTLVRIADVVREKLDHAHSPLVARFNLAEDEVRIERGARARDLAVIERTSPTKEDTGAVTSFETIDRGARVFLSPPDAGAVERALKLLEQGLETAPPEARREVAEAIARIRKLALEADGGAPKARLKALLGVARSGMGQDPDAIRVVGRIGQLLRVG